MSQDNLFRLKCSICKSANYYTAKNKKMVER
ncbi:MAG: 50S ribosomal protein L33, partial [Patescibacteria group bacterium]